MTDPNNPATILAQPPDRATLLREVLLQDDLPKIDTALKNFCSWMMASAHTFSDWTPTEVLTATRLLSQTINAHESSAHTDLAQVWNKVFQAPDQKATKILGRTSLRAVWNELDLTRLKTGVWEEKGLAYLNTFESFLFASRSEEAGVSSDDLLLDARLVWDADGGKEELARRSKQRQQQAKERSREESKTAHTTPTIEEVPEEDEQRGQLKSDE